MTASVDRETKLRHYANKAIDITYDARRCIHAKECIRGLPAVFDTDRRPWILPSGASADAIATVIERCPSGALHYTRRDGGATEFPPEQTTITPVPGGPLYLYGLIQLRSAIGGLVLEDTRMALCRCGQSQNKPFCDDSHVGTGFDDVGTHKDRDVGYPGQRPVSTTSASRPPTETYGLPVRDDLT